VIVGWEGAKGMKFEGGAAREVGTGPVICLRAGRDVGTAVGAAASSNELREFAESKVSSAYARYTSFKIDAAIIALNLGVNNDTRTFYNVRTCFLS
jgi:hypothetical protein